MNIDINALRMIEADKGISIDTVITAIETALLTAYRHTDGFAPHARIDVNRKSGAVRVMAQEVDEDGTVVHEYDDTPEGFGRIAATTARQVILQRLRDAENEKNFGDFVTHEGEIVGGVVQQDARANARGMIVVQIGSDANSAEGIIPPAEQVPGESYKHGDRIKCYVVGVSRGPRGPPPLDRERAASARHDARSAPAGGEHHRRLAGGGDLLRDHAHRLGLRGGAAGGELQHAQADDLLRLEREHRRVEAELPPVTVEGHGRPPAAGDTG